LVLSTLSFQKAPIFRIVGANQQIEPNCGPRHAAIEQPLVPIQPVCMGVGVHEYDRGCLLPFEAVDAFKRQLSLGQYLITFSIVITGIAA
jgi:hypothetical protein